MPDDPAKKAEEVLAVIGIQRVPIDPFRIVAEEGIELAPSAYGPKFDARLEFSREIDNYILFYKSAGSGRPFGRVRFSIAHELGHFYLSHHRERLERGRAHNSISDFRSGDPIEREADAFAAALLMPSRQFVAAVRKFRSGICTLPELCILAEDVFGTSLTSTAIRYCEHDLEPCAIVISERRRVRWVRCSDGMRSLGMGYIPFGSPVPPSTVTSKLWEQLDAGEPPDAKGARTDASVWYARPRRPVLWEEAMMLGRTGLVLSYLTLGDQG